MSVTYTWVGWNRQKKMYDAVVAGGIAAYLILFVTGGKLLASPGEGLSSVTLLIRALGTCGIVLLHIVLCIGPMARLDGRLLPLLYNRRHLGVMTFFVGCSHAVLSIFWYHAGGDINPLLSLLTANTNYLSIGGFPFETLGLLSLLILFLMAATSHDFWLKNLSPRIWKSLHMLVYAAYGLLVMHVVLGVLQHERSLVYPVLLGGGVLVVGGLHIAAGLRENHSDARGIAVEAGDATGPRWVDVGSVDEIPDKRAKIVCLRDMSSREPERIAVFRHNGTISVVSNVCEHQGGPLGEGKIVGGCITCPWHGYQYAPESGQSPPPFTEKIKTYEVRVEGRRILVNPVGNPRGTRVEPARFEEPTSAPSQRDDTSRSMAE
ncbi:MAG: ferric reductase-like transmembrane domain-containing protein [Pyrinomonadaceae bacterium]|nr:ferric reductase-like transmembrane domain-containing protein [Phycisphaerales bacterium]